MLIVQFEPDVSQLGMLIKRCSHSEQLVDLTLLVGHLRLVADVAWVVGSIGLGGAFSWSDR